MMAGNPSWWSMHHSNLRSSSSSPSDHEADLFISQTHLSTTSLLPLQFIHGSSSSSSSASTSSSMVPFSSSAHDHHGQDFPHSWSQLLLGGLASEQEEIFGPSLFHSTRVMSSSVGDHVKQEVSSPNNNNNINSTNYFYGYSEEQDQGGVSNKAALAWSRTIPASSTKSCVTTLSSSNNITNANNTNNNSNNNNNDNNLFDFSASKRSLQADSSHQHGDHPNSECNSPSNGGVPNKKPRVQSSSTPPLKVRKEKLGDRITALHQLVSPFGKTDTASVLLEAIGYVRFLQGQIEALSSPYLGNNNASANNPHSVQGERNCLFPDHPGQLLNDSCLKRRGAAIQEDNTPRDLKSRGLCLVPISCTQLVGSDNGADYWAPSLGGGF